MSEYPRTDKECSERNSSKYKSAIPLSRSHSCDGRSAYRSYAKQDRIPSLI